jgi:hypothetical protein
LRPSNVGVARHGIRLLDTKSCRRIPKGTVTSQLVDHCGARLAAHRRNTPHRSAVEFADLFG